MAITFGIAPNPHWVIIDNFSKLPNGAAIYTFSSKLPNQLKPAYQTPNINTPFTNPIVGFGNGTFPPIYWLFDDSNPDDLYYIEVWDKVIVPGGDAVMLWSFGPIGPTNVGGGGGTTTTNLDLENLVINGEFYWNVVDQPIAPATSVPALITLAPSNHDGFQGYEHPSGGGPVGPDIIFAKSNTNASDSLSFIKFPQGDSTFSTGGSLNQPTPEKFVKYACTIAGGAETYKFIQFPIMKGLQNLNNIQVSVQMWAQLIGGNNSITLNLRQFFGNGSNGPSADVNISLGSLTFSANDWTRTQFLSVIVPSIAGKVLGNCGNDALYLQIGIPLTVTTDFNFILPAVYIGTATSELEFHSRDFVDAIAMSPRTGDIRTSVNSFHPYGWVPMNDGTIGNTASAATTRADIDTFPLYDLIWNSVSQALAPVTGGRGARADTDFAAGKPIALTRNLGRVMAGALPASLAQAFTNVGNIITVSTSDTTSFYNGMAIIVSGGALPTPLVNGNIYYAIVLSPTTMSLATTTANALAGTAIVLTTNASGTITPVNVETLGSYIGEEDHLQALNELVAHIHTLSPYTPTTGASGSGVAAFTSAGSISTDAMAAGRPFNIMQPTVYMNVFIKL